MATAVAKEAKRFGRYTLLGHIADGGMASVYLAQLRGDHRFSKWVALKVVHAKHAGDPRFEKMFLTEARIAARIDHPNVGQVFDSGVVDGTPYLAMEYLSGKTLQKLFSEARAHRIPFPLPIAARIIADAALGLHAAHELRDDNGASIGVVHRDVSPHNIFILYSGATKLMDFGIAASRDRYDEEKTAIDELKGKLAYMSPEQMCRQPLDRRSDIFSLGIVLWEITCGKRLFKRNSEGETALALLSEPIPKPSSVVPDYPPELEKIVMRCLQRKPDDRYAMASELAADLAMFTGFDAEAPTIITISAGEVVREFSELTITGTNLSGGAVTIGGAPQPIVSMSDTEIVAGPITAETPLGIQPVMVTTGGGNSGTMNVEVLEPFRMLLPTATSETTVDVKLNREVDVSTVAPERFTIGGLTVESASASGDTITLTTSAQVPEATYTISASGLRDRLGAPITSDTVSFQGFQPPPPSEFIVVRVGDGTTPPGDVAAPVFLERRSIADGSLIGTLPLPTAASGANHPLTLVSGPNGYSEGSLSRSEDGRFLAIAGYPAAPGDANPNSGNEARVVAIIDADDFGPTPNVDTSTRLGTAFVGTRPWGAVIDGPNIWAVGGWGGVHHVTRGSGSSMQIAGTPSGGRSIGIFGGHLYYASNTGLGLYQVGSGLPTSMAATALVYGGPASEPPDPDNPPINDPYTFTGFDLDPTEPGIDTFYQSNAGVERWVKSGGTWKYSTKWTGPARHVACVRGCARG